MNILTLFKGKLTYTMAAIAVLWAVIGYLASWIDGDTAATIAWGGLTTFGMRRAIK